MYKVDANAPVTPRGGLSNLAPSRCMWRKQRFDSKRESDVKLEQFVSLSTKALKVTDKLARLLNKSERLRMIIVEIFWI